jgi:DNA repair protein RecO (recombination protein O)
MRISDKAVVINAVKYADKKQIVRIYTRTHGLVTVSAIPGHSPQSKIRTASLLPLTFIDAVYSGRPNRDIQNLRECSVYFSPHLTGDISKLAIAQFINEVLVKALKEQSPNSRLFDFIEHCMDLLNRAESGFADLHLYFMLELSKHSGFDPQNNFSADTPCFDCREGMFSEHCLPFPIGFDTRDSALFASFLNSSFMGRQWSGVERQHILECLIAYYSFHVPSFQELKSVAVLKEVLTG